MNYRQEAIKPYSDAQEKREQVEEMFDNIAPTYDKLNHRLSLNIDKLWRKYAIKRLLSAKPKSLLDIATGTGDFAIQAAKFLQPEKIIGVDISEGMMNIAQKKVEAERLTQVISFKKDDCENLSFDNDSFDAITTAFGIRNFQHLEKSISEMYRVLKNDGQLCIIELTRPLSFPMKQLFWLYGHTFLPIYGKLVSKDTKAYKYLMATIEAFPQGETMMELFRNTGFKTFSYKKLTFGICTLYLATK